MAAFEALYRAPRPDNDCPSVFLQKGPRLRPIFLLPICIFHIEECHNIHSHESILLSQVSIPSIPAWRLEAERRETTLIPVVLYKQCCAHDPMVIREAAEHFGVPGATAGIWNMCDIPALAPGTPSRAGAASDPARTAGL